MCVFSTKAGGINTLYNDNELIFFDDKNDLTDKLLDVLEHPESYDNLRKNLHNKIINFTWNNVKDKWINILNLY